MKQLNKDEWIKRIYNSYEDGTGESLSVVLSEHKVTDTEVIKLAWDEITKYIGFCMDIFVEYWSESDNDYISAYFKVDKEKVDFNKWKITHFQDRKVFYPDYQINDEYYSHCLNMYKADGGYGSLFSKMLDGHTYKN